MNRQRSGRMFVIGAVIGWCALPAPAIDGLNLPTKYDGFLAASQANATFWGNHVNVHEEGIVVGNELDSLWVSADLNDLWIGLPGNLPNQLAYGQSIVILLQFEGAPPSPPWPNVLNTNALTGFGGGWAAITNLHGTILEPGFYPDNVVVVNRYAESTYVNSWYLPSNAPDTFFDDLVSLDPFNQPLCQESFPNGCYLSAWMDTTNVVGVDANEATDGAGQQALAVTATKGLRLRLRRSYFGFGGTIKIMAILTAQDGMVSNQILPPLSTADDPVAPNCLGPTPNFDETYDPVEEPPVENFGLAGTQYAVVDLTVNAGTPAAVGGFDGTDIRAAWPAGTEVATQQIHTCFGDAVFGWLDYTIPGSELDQMFVRTDGQYLYVAISGNLEGNGNKVVLFIDADPNAGENTLDNNSPAPPDPTTLIYNWRGRKFDGAGAPDWFAPEHAYLLNNWAGTLYVDYFDLLLADALVQQYQGYSAVGGSSGVLAGGNNPNGNEFILNDSNNYGVVGVGNPGAPGDPATATSGLEAKISLVELGLTLGDCTNVKVMAILAGGDSAYLSNQCLPSFTADTNTSVGGDYAGPPFDFGSITPPGGHAAFDGDQFVSVALRRLGDVQDDGNCCINLNDLNRFVLVLLGQVNDPEARFYSDMNGDGTVDGEDIQLFVNAILAEGPCP